MKQHLSNHWLRNFGEQIIIHMANTFDDAAIFIVDHNQTILYWSEGAEQILGFTAQEVEGQHCLKGIRCMQCMKGCGVQQYNNIDNVLLEMHTKDGHSFKVRKHAQALYDSSGNFAGAIEILRPETQPQKSTNVMEQSFSGVQFHGMITQSDTMRRLFQQVRSVAKTDVPVLARGESGTGKELLAKSIHLESSRKNQPFIAVNCSAIPENLIESELFGHAKGAFTGAHKERKGLFEQAHKGSLFLDEIAELPLSVQAKLLRVLESQTFKRVGENTEVHVDVRIITATHKSLRQAVQEGKFRQDLMYRLRVVPLFLPPLRSRPVDIEILLEHFIEQGNTQHQNQILTIDAQAKEALLRHSWPGNVREVRNVIDFAFAIGCTNQLTLDFLPPEFNEEYTEPALHHAHSPSPQSPLKQPSQPPPPSTFFSEKERILSALQQCNYHLGDAAKLLGVSRATLWRKRKQYNL